MKKLNIIVLIFSILLSNFMPFINVKAEKENPENEYLVTFNSNGGSNIESQTVTNGETIVRPNDPTKEGYTFVNWYLDYELTPEFDFATTISENVTLYAKWNVIKPVINISGNKLTEYTQTKDFAIEISDEVGLKAGSYRVKYALGNSSGVYTCNSPEMSDIKTITVEEGAKIGKVDVHLEGVEASRITICNLDDIVNVNGGKINGGTARMYSLYVDAVAPTITALISEEDDGSKFATITLKASFAKFTAGTYTIKYSVGDNEISCDDMTDTLSATVKNGDSTATWSFEINENENLYVCNLEGISDLAGNILLPNTVVKAVEIFSETFSRKEYGTYEDAKNIVKEVEKAFYIRGKNIQYNTSKKTYSSDSPEETTWQNQTYKTCSAYGYGVLAEAFGM